MTMHRKKARYIESTELKWKRHDDDDNKKQWLVASLCLSFGPWSACICSFFSLHWGTVSISTAKVRCTECRTLEYNWQHNLLNQSTSISMPLDQLCERASLKRLFMVIIHMRWCDLWILWCTMQSTGFHIESFERISESNEWAKQNNCKYDKLNCFTHHL